MKAKLLRYIKRIKEGRLKTLFEEITWVYSYGKSQLFYIIVFTLIGFSDTILTLFNSVASKDLVDIVTGHNTGEVVSTFLLMIGLSLATLFVSLISSFVSSVITTKVSNNIQADIYDKIMMTEWESLSKYHSGDISSRWSSDSSIVADGILTLIPNLLQVVFRFVSALFVVIQYDASFVVFALISAPVSLLISRRNIRRMRKTNKDAFALNSQISSITTEAFSNFQFVKAFNLFPLYSKKIRELQKERLDYNIKYQKNNSLNTIIMSITSSIVTYTTYGWGIYKVWSGAITYGTMTLFLTLSSSLAASLSSLLSVVPTTLSISTSARRLMEISTLPKEDYSQEENVKAFFNKHSDTGIGLLVNDITYSYANGNEVFDNIDFKANPREVVALVGPSGEGKTTMLRLLLSLVRGQEGTASIFAYDNSDSNSLDLLSLSASARQLFAYVPQGNTMFTGTIAENMRFVKEDATDEEIENALKLACAWDFVNKLPDGINTPIKERGGGFSEGQAQRLSIARALIRKSPILLLDEATSALDIYTEKKVLENIMMDDYPRTTIVTAHRLSVIKACNKVYKIHDKTCSLMSSEEITEMLNS